MSRDPLTEALPSLPQNDLVNLVVRQNMIERRRMLFNFTKFSRLGGFPNTIELPPAFFPLPPSYSVPLDENMYSYEVKLLERQTYANLNESLRNKFSQPIRTLQDYADATGFLKPQPKLLSQNEKQLWGWLNDEEFARQRLQGLNPEKIELVDEQGWEKRFSNSGTTPFNLDIALKEINNVIVRRGGQDFQTALANKDIYVCDYSIFTMPSLAVVAQVFNRYISAPIALFCRNPSTRCLYPLAIQLFPGISDTIPVFVADDSMDWLLAKIWVNSADGQHQEVLSHLYETHFMAECFQISMNRQMGANHPIYQLLHPHFFATLFINQVARSHLLSQSGAINEVIATGVPGAAIMINEFKKTFKFQDHSFVNSLKARGLATTGEESLLSGYFWEEDGMKLWNIMHKFVTSVLDLFYHTEKDIAHDFELQQWIAEVESTRGGDLQGVSECDGKIVTVEYLADLLTNLLWICTAKHSSGNIDQFELYGFIPNVPGALYTPPPTTHGKTDKAAIIAALPPQHQTLAQVAISYLIADTAAHPPHLVTGTYPGLETHAEANIHIQGFHQSLQNLSDTIGVRNGNLTYPYVSLDPARVSNSIFI